MLTLATGANIVVFSIFHTALRPPLSFRDPDRVVQLWELRQDRARGAIAPRRHERFVSSALSLRSPRLCGESDAPR